MISKYLRIGTVPNVTRGHPIGLVVADTDGAYVYFGFALCSKKDTFVYDRAKEIARGRLKSSKFKVPIAIPNPEASVCSGQEIVDAIANGDRAWQDSLAPLKDLFGWVAERTVRVHNKLKATK